MKGLIVMMISKAADIVRAFAYPPAHCVAALYATLHTHHTHAHSCLLTFLLEKMKKKNTNLTILDKKEMRYPCIFYLRPPRVFSVNVAVSSAVTL